MISNSYNCHNARLPVPARKNLLFAGDSLNEQNFSDKILRYKMAIIYIHIGTHKTGSTAIQETLRINKKLLKKNNCMLLRIKGLCDRILKMDSFDINRLDIEKNNVKRTIKKDIFFQKGKHVDTNFFTLFLLSPQKINIGQK